MITDLHTIIVKAFNLESLSPEKQLTYVLAIADQAFDRSIPKILSDLTEEQMQQYDDYLETNPNPEDMIDYLSKLTPKFGDIVNQELMEIKNSNDLLKMAQ